MDYKKEVIEKRSNVLILEEPKIDVSIFKKKSNSKTFKGFLIGKIKQARDDKNTELVILLGELYKKYQEFNTASFNPKKWRGKSGVQFIEQPEIVISIRFRKKEPNNKPEEVKLELLREDINNVILILNKRNKDVWIETSDIAEELYHKEWKLVFSDRKKHIYLVEILNYLEYKGLIEYSRSGKVKVK